MRVGEPCVYVTPDNVEMEATITKVYEADPDAVNHVDVIMFEPGTPDATATTVVNAETNRIAGGPPYVYQRSS